MLKVTYMQSSAQAADPKLPSVSGTSVPDSCMGRKLQPPVQSKLLSSESRTNLLAVRGRKQTAVHHRRLSQSLGVPGSTSLFALPWEHQGLESREHCANKSRLLGSFKMTETAELERSGQSIQILQ